MKIVVFGVVFLLLFLCEDVGEAVLIGEQFAERLGGKKAQGDVGVIMSHVL